MFISRKEKEELWLAVRSLQAKVRDLEIEAVWLKNKLYKPKAPVIAKDETAPWGQKQDGTPRKRPGRKASPPSSLTDVVIL
jgi:hypothetical protein